MWVGEGAVLFLAKARQKEKYKNIKIFDKSWFQSPQVREKKEKLARFLYWVFSV
jgi:hypothetical protein